MQSIISQGNTTVRLRPEPLLYIYQNLEIQSCRYIGPFKLTLLPQSAVSSVHSTMKNSHFFFWGYCKHFVYTGIEITFGNVTWYERYHVIGDMLFTRHLRKRAHCKCFSPCHLCGTSQSHWVLPGTVINVYTTCSATRLYCVTLSLHWQKESYI